MLNEIILIVSLDSLIDKLQRIRDGHYASKKSLTEQMYSLGSYIEQSALFKTLYLIFGFSNCIDFVPNLPFNCYHRIALTFQRSSFDISVFVCLSYQSEFNSLLLSYKVLTIAKMKT